MFIDTDVGQRGSVANTEWNVYQDMLGQCFTGQLLPGHIFHCTSQSAICSANSYSVSLGSSWDISFNS